MAENEPTYTLTLTDDEKDWLESLLASVTYQPESTGGDIGRAQALIARLNGRK